MKRLIVLMIIFLNVNLFAKEPVLILKKDSGYYTEDQIK